MPRNAILAAALGFLALACGEPTETEQQAPPTTATATAVSAATASPSVTAPSEPVFWVEVAWYGVRTFGFLKAHPDADRQCIPAGEITVDINGVVGISGEDRHSRREENRAAVEEAGAGSRVTFACTDGGGFGFEGRETGAISGDTTNANFECAQVAGPSAPWEAERVTVNLSSLPESIPCYRARDPSARERDAGIRSIWACGDTGWRIAIEAVLGSALVCPRGTP